MPPRSYHVLDLFAGIGGFALGLRNSKLHAEQTFFSEVDPFCQKVLQKNFPESVQLGDIKEIDGKELRTRGRDWIVTGGFPCQNLSVAGKRTGLRGSQSGLWFEMLRLIDEIRPRWIVGENVKHLAGNGLDRVCRGLSDCGYVSEWRTFSAAQFGFPHNRHRLFLVAYPSGDGRGGDELRHTIGRTVGDFPEPKCQIGGTSEWLDWVRPFLSRSVSAEPLASRVDNGVRAGVDLARMKALGNSLIPKIPETIFNRLAQLDEDGP